MDEDNAASGWLRPYLDARFGGLDEQVKGLRGDFGGLAQRVERLEQAQAERQGEDKVRRGTWGWIVDKAGYVLASIIGALASHLIGGKS